MGFSKKAAVLEIEVPMEFRVKDDNKPGVEEYTNVKHVFRHPTAAQRERHRNESVDVKRGRPQTKTTKANRNLWNATIVRVEGYDDIANQSEPATFGNYFDDEIGSIHVDAAVIRMMNLIGDSEVETEKK